ncbi:MAG: DNA repair protein [Bacteroidetes bacterium HGW-Bacteroidetes-17]|jgi:DNA repair protein RadC|nr:MAG: DNA repair protein [Bacteroidetes bacterium HGW-Bacteroidetes-17]
MNIFTQNVAEIKISYSTNVRPSDRIQISSSSASYKIFEAIFLESCDIEYREFFYVMLLNRANKCLGVSQISAGGQSGTVADPKLIFQAALKASASSIILCHNHPSGNLKPSEADIKLTNKIIAGGKLLDLPVLDHLIITSEAYYSFADEGLIS